MLSARTPKLFRTVAFRLAVWYAALFSMSLLALYLAFYFMLSAYALRLTDGTLREEVLEVSGVMDKSLEALAAEIRREAEFDGVQKIFFRLLDREGNLIASSDLSSWGDLNAHVPAGRWPESEGKFFTVALASRPAAIRILEVPLDATRRLQVGLSMEESAELLKRIREVFGMAFLAVVAVSGLAGWFMARRAMSGVERVTEAAAAIAGGALGRRVALGGGGEEIDRLAETFNTMVDRIERLLTGMKEITDNIAHDLRSPIARMRGMAELLLAQPGSAEEAGSVAEATVEECDRLLQMINTMLDISELEAGVAKLNLEEVAVAPLVEAICELFKPAAEEKGVRLAMAVEDVGRIRADCQGLERAVANVLDNALKYTPPDGDVRVDVRRANGAVQIAVMNTGAGIAEEELPRVFDRFYRGDQSRSYPGSGLGLSLTRALMQAHGGGVAVHSRPGQGATFTLSLPCEGLPART